METPNLQLVMFDVTRVSDKLKLGADGIWRGADASPVSYPADGNASCFELESSSFWFQHRNECIIAAVKNFLPQAGDAIADIGGGNGYVAMGLVNAGFDVVLVEPGAEGARNAHRRGVKNVVYGTTETAAIKPASLGAIGLFDVVEHTQDDLAFLVSMRRLLRPGGSVYITVPSYPFLWSNEDIVAGHFRRYSKASVLQVLSAAGFETAYFSYFFRPLPLAIFLRRSLPYRLGFSEKAVAQQLAIKDHKSTALSRLAQRAMQAEVSNIKDKREMRFGASCLVVAQ